MGIALLLLIGFALVWSLKFNYNEPNAPELSNSVHEFYDLDVGNQNDLIYYSNISLDWIDSTKEKYDWENFGEYDNRMWEYMYKLFDDVVKESGAKDNVELWNNLNRAQKTFWTFLSFNGDTDNGGVYQFIFNRPQFIFAVAEMWEEIGMTQVAVDYNEVLKELTGKTGKISELKEAWNDESNSFEKRWASFTEGYQELKSTEKIEAYYYKKEFKKECHKHMADYIERNMDKFRK